MVRIVTPTQWMIQPYWSTSFQVDGKEIVLHEEGPRFQLRLYEIKLGTLEAEAAADTEWALRPFMNTAKKRRFLSDEDGWDED